jgi:hypothetical protein
VEITTPAHLIGVGAAHSAFPSLVRRPEGTLELVWRQGTNHATSRDGTIRRTVSRDGGLTYVEATHLRSGGADYRDPSISYARGAYHLTWFTGTNVAPALGAWDQREWGVAVRIDPSLPYAATCAPVVELPDTRLGAVFYGRKAGEAVDTAWMAWTNNHGATWTSNRIANGIGAGRAYSEPWLVRDGADIHVFFRSGVQDAIGVRSSHDSGTTWDPVREILANASGRPTTLRTAAGALVMVYRKLPTRGAAIAYSLDHGATWQNGGVLLEPPAGSPNGMTYAALVETEPDLVQVVFGMEATVTSSVLYGATLTMS